jgi:hypothetical protein
MEFKKVLSGLTLTAVLFLYTACSKDNDKGNISDTDIGLARDEAYVDAIFDELDNLAVTEVKSLDDNDYSASGLKSTDASVCYTVTVDHPDTTTFPKVITIDFGDGCSAVFNGDTITRSGQVSVTITNRWFVPGAQHILTFNNFYFNGAKVEGTRTITNEGWNNKLHLLISVDLENGKVTFNDTAFVTRNASHDWEWALHMNPVYDTIWVNGNASGTNILGESYTRTITSPLVLVRCSNMQYRWGFTAGTMEVENSERGNMTITYTGDGCSNDVIITKDGNEYQYRFRYRRWR